MTSDMVLGAEFENVLVAAQAGADWAFARLYTELNPRLVRYFTAQAPEAAEDLAAETWMAAARQLPGFEGTEGAFRGWMFTIAHGKLVQHWRHAKRRPKVTSGLDAAVGEAASSDPARDALESATAHEAVELIVRSLTPDQAQVVLLRVLADLDVDQVARIIGKRPGAVRVLQHRALRRLAETNFYVEPVTG